MKKNLLMIICASAFLVACGEKQAEKPVEEVHTVDWFKQKENHKLLWETVKACQNDPGVLGKTPNCVNALEAHTQLLLEQVDKANRESRKAYEEEFNKK